MTARRILVRATNWLGDAILSLPALHALRAAFPQAHITILGQGWVRDLYAGESFCDEVMAYPAARGAKDLGAKWQTIQQLQAGRYDAALLLQNALEAALVTRLAGIPVRVGYNRDARGWLLTNAIAVPQLGEIHPHERFYYLELLRRAGWIAQYDPESPIRLQGAEEARHRGRLLLGKAGLSGRIIGISPGAAFGSAKRWYPDRFAAAAARIAREHQASIAIFGGKEEAAVCQQVADHLGGLKIVNFAGRTSLRDFLDLVAACHLMLTNDSGAMHVAYAMGVPSVTVFGSTDEIGTGPTGPVARIVREPVDCAPCKLRECPIDHRCMQRVSAEKVAETALLLLK
jgi:heptosyltransferase II